MDCSEFGGFGVCGEFNAVVGSFCRLGLIGIKKPSFLGFFNELGVTLRSCIRF